MARSRPPRSAPSLPPAGGGIRATRSRAGRRLLGELRALAHPLRLRLIEHFAGEPRTTLQVATILGEPPTRLYHHVHILERAGILVLRHTRRVRGTTERYYGVAKRELGSARPEEVSAGSRQALGGLATLVFEEARADLQAAIAGAKLRDPAVAPTALRMLLSVPPSRQARIRRRIRDMLLAIRRDLRNCKPGSGEPWALTIAFAPRLGGKPRA